LHTVSFVHGCFAGKCIPTGSTEYRYFKAGWQRGEKVGYCYPSGLEKTLCKWDVYVPLVTKGLRGNVKKTLGEFLFPSVGSILIMLPAVQYTNFM